METEKKPKLKKDGTPSRQGEGGGRLWLLTEKLLEKAEGYISWTIANPKTVKTVSASRASGDCDDEPTEKVLETRDRLPSKFGLCVFLKISINSLESWMKIEPVTDDEKKLLGGFKEIVHQVETHQAATTIENAAVKSYDSGFSKLIMNQHGWREKSDVTSDGQPIAVPQELPPDIKDLKDRYERELKAKLTAKRK